MPENKYWEGRFTQLEQQGHEHAAKTLAQLERDYKAAQLEIEQKTLHWYQRFADNNGITMAQAKVRLNDPELKELKWTVQEYIKAGREMALDGRWMKELENASARFHITRLEALQLQNQQTIEALFGNQRDQMESLLKHTYLDRYYHSAFELQKGFGVGWDIAMIDEGALARIISRPWTTDGKNFSTRLWGSKQQLIGELQKQITQNLLTGKAPNASIDAIAKQFGVSRNQAGRLVMTESAYFASLSQQDAFNALGVKRYTIVATLDDRTSETCRQMDGEVFEMKDFQAGVSAPPFHPWCRSVTAPYFDDMKGIGERAARGEDGQVYYVPREMKYDEWYDTFIEGGNKEILIPATPGGKITVRDSLAACTTVAEVEDLMKSQRWFNVQTLNGKVFDTNDRLSLEGIELEAAKSVFVTHEKIFTKYPQLIGKLNAISTASLSPHTYAQCMVGTGNGAVSLNKKFFGNIKRMVKGYTNDLAYNYHPKGTQWHSIVTHEIGHAIDDYLTHTLKLAGMKNRSQPKWVSADLRPKVMRAAGFKVSDALTEISEYATKNHLEWFAEVFSEYMDSPTPRKVAVEFGKQFDELMKGVK